MVIGQGDVCWAQLAAPFGSEPGLRRPVVVVQNDLFNQSRIETVVICPLTSNLRHSSCPGNVALGKGEANISRRSVVNISQVTTVDRQRLVSKIGTLSHQRVRDILAGIYLLLEPIADE